MHGSCGEQPLTGVHPPCRAATPRAWRLACLLRKRVLHPAEAGKHERARAKTGRGQDLGEDAHNGWEGEGQQEGPDDSGRATGARHERARLGSKSGRWAQVGTRRGVQFMRQRARARLAPGAAAEGKQKHRSQQSANSSRHSPALPGTCWGCRVEAAMQRWRRQKSESKRTKVGRQRSGEEAKLP